MFGLITAAAGRASGSLTSRFGIDLIALDCIQGGNGGMLPYCHTQLGMRLGFMERRTMRA